MAETTKKILEIEIDVDSGDVKTLNKEVGKTAKNTEKAQKGVGGLASGFKKVGTAMKAAGIGLIVALLAKLADVLSNNQQAADFFTVSMNALTIAFNDLFKFISENMSTVTDFFKQIFDDPIGSLKKLGEAIQENLIERFNSLLDTLGYAGDALTKFFEGDFTGAMESAKQAGKELVDVYTGVNNSFDKTVQFVSNAATAIADYTKSTIDAAIATEQLNKQAEIAAILQQGVIEDYDRQAELLRQIRDDETKTFDERIAANDKLGLVLQDQIKAQIELIDIQQAAIENNLKNGLIPEFEAKKQLLELENERKAVLATVTGFESEQLINKNALLREQLDLEKQSLADRLAAEKAASDQSIALAQKEADVKNQIQGSVFAFASLLTDQFGKKSEAAAKRAFQVNKALGIAEAVINTAKGINKALAETTDPTPTQSFRFGSAIAVGLAGALQVATIASTQFSAGASGGGSAGGVNIPTAQSQAPQFNTVGASGVNQLDESINNQNRRPTEAYVVSGNITTAQSLDRNRIDEATL
jgi:hypothetical protein